MEKNNVLEFAGRERISDPLTALLRSGAQQLMVLSEETGFWRQAAPILLFLDEKWQCQSKTAWGRQSRSLASSDEKSIPLFQLVARDYSPHGDDVCPVSSVAAAGRGSSVWTRHQYLPRDGTVLVEPFWPDVCGGDQKTARSKPFVFSLARAFGRDFCAYQRRDTLSLAGSRSRRRGSWGVRHKAAGSQGCA